MTQNRERQAYPGEPGGMDRFSRPEGSGRGAEVSFLRDRMRAAELPDNVTAAAEQELIRLEKLPYASPEYSLTRAFFDWILALPWNARTEDRLDIHRAQQVLEQGHFGLEFAKEQILDFLAVMQMRRDGRAQALCLVGPRGAGKTSLGHSIARALDRRLVRISVRGFRDETEIYGQRRTFPDALPGRILRQIRAAGVRNPVFLIEDLDRLGANGRGDVLAALSAVLDAKLRDRFTDHFLELPFDLSEVLFIATAGLAEFVPESLRGGLQIIPLPGYVQEEKLQIARRYLIPRERERCGLAEEQLVVPEVTARQLVGRHAAEAGVTELQHRVAEVARRAARQIAAGERTTVQVGTAELEQWMGPGLRGEPRRRTPEVGVTGALVITPEGGRISLLEITRTAGRGDVTITGPLGPRLQELVQTAWTILRARAKKYDLDPAVFDATHLHVHMPDAPAPSDLDALGLAVVASLVSAHTGKPIRSDLALTGATSLRGRLRYVGGVVEKVLAARRAEIDHVIVPADCAAQLDQLPSYVREALEMHPLQTVDEALDLAVMQIIVPKPEEASAIGIFQKDPSKPAPNNR